MKESISQHVTGLPPSLLRAFEARPPPRHLDPVKRRKPPLPYSGVAQYVQGFAEPGDPEYEPPPSEARPPEPRVFRNPELAAQARVEAHSKPEREVYVAQERAARHAGAVVEAAAGWDPSKDPSVEGDPFKTLFVARLSYDVSERKLRREFEEFGPVKRVRLVHDKNTGKPRGYAFVEFESKSAMKEAYKAADGRKIEGRRCLVDVERGRTVPQWRPRRLGGGKGGETRTARPPKDPKRQFVRRLIEQAMPRPEQAAPPLAPAEARRGDGDAGRRDRERDRDGGRHRSSSAAGDRGGGRDYRDSRGGGRERERDDRRDDRKRDRSSRGEDRYGGGYSAVPPPGQGPPPYAPRHHQDEELEEGEMRGGGGGGGGGERYAKRPRERDML